mmetsp:Transcript_33864/g.112020  ORF Transcript_33864/g.112020 Transcript_33864/m.112020 type:complete len:201 (+) Transcript_33864:525-1127(+)
MSSASGADASAQSSPTKSPEHTHAPLTTSQTPLPEQPSPGQSIGGGVTGSAICSAVSVVRLTSNRPPAEKPITSGCISMSACAGGRTNTPDVTATASKLSVTVPARIPCALCHVTLSTIVCRSHRGQNHHPPLHNEVRLRPAYTGGHGPGSSQPSEPPPPSPTFGSRGSSPAGSQPSTRTLLPMSSGEVTWMVTATTEPR